MIKYKRISILKTDADIIVCPISSDKIFSNKLTQSIFIKYLPINFNNLSLQKGCVRNVPTINGNKWLCLFPTKEKCYDTDSYDYIVSGLKSYSNTMLNYEKTHSVIPNISFPQLGTGDVDWLDIQVVMEQYLDVLNQQVLIHINKEDNKLALDKRKR